MIRADKSTLIVIDMQQRLMPAIENAQGVVANVKRLIDAASVLSIETLFTEQNADGLGPTVEGLTAGAKPTVFHKKHFDTTKEGELLQHLPTDRDLVVAGCEAHVCVMQTVLGLLAGKRRVFIVTDAIGSRLPHNKRAAIERMVAHGAEAVTMEMVLFEWLDTSDHPQFKDVLALIK